MSVAGVSLYCCDELFTELSVVIDIKQSAKADFSLSKVSDNSRGGSSPIKWESTCNCLWRVDQAPRSWEFVKNAQFYDISRKLK